MPYQPDVGDVHVNTLLTQVSIGYNPGGFIADEIFPIVGVDKQSDIYASYDKSFWARDDGASAQNPNANKFQRAPGTNAASAGFKLTTTATYFASNEAIGVELPDELIANADAVFDLESDAAKLVVALLRMRRDRAFVADFFTNIGVWGTDQTVTADFSNYGTSTPIENFRTAIRTVRRQALASQDGQIVITLGALVWDRLADHPDIIDRIKYGGVSGPAIAAPELLAQLLTTAAQYPVVVKVGTGVFTTTTEGTAEASVTYTDIFGGNALTTWRPNSPSRLLPSSGYTFVWRPLVGGGAAIEFVRRIREERPRKTIIEAHVYYDQVATLTDTGVFMSSAST